MKYELVDVDFPKLFEVERTPGMHVSQVIHYLAVKLGLLESEENSSIVLTDLWAALGHALEYAIAWALAKYYPDEYIHQPGELFVDGLYGNQDFNKIEDDELIPVEVKLSWLSSKHNPDSPKFWRYVTQLKSYCYMVGSNRGYLYVCHVNGSGFGPEFKVYLLEFSDQELAENWRLLCTTARRVVREVSEVS